MELSVPQQRVLLETARHIIRASLAASSSAAPADDDPALHQPAGSFVTLHTLQGHRLRGCVGRLDPSLGLIESVRHSAASVLRDPRFENERIKLEDLNQLEIEITVVLPPEPAADVLDFDPLEHGIYLTIDGRTGCFLPQVARETGWTREQLLGRLCTEKMGLSESAWRSPGARLMRFHTVIIGPEPFE